MEVPTGPALMTLADSRRDTKGPPRDATSADPSALPAAEEPVHHPAVSAHLTLRAEDCRSGSRTRSPAFAGSMIFVYVHVVVFAVWMLVFERSPWPTLTLVVSLEAIFLSTFVMIGQNRQASFQQAKADHDFVAQEQELHGNTELTQGDPRADRADPRPGRRTMARDRPAASRIRTLRSAVTG